MKADSIPSRQLPERVQAAIRNQQDESERLVGWFQLAVVSLFSLLYAVSPKTFDSHQTFALVPWFLAAVEAWNATLTAEGRPQVRIGAAVSTGQIIFGAVGDATRLEYTVIGDAVNLGAKLEKHNKDEGVQALTTETAYELALQQGYHSLEEDRMLKRRKVEGVDDPMDLVVLAF